MGSIARMRQAEKFIDEFEKDYVDGCDLKPGMQLTVDRLGLGQDECDDSRLVLFVVCKDAKGLEYTFDVEQVLDCEYDGSQDLLERVTNALGIKEAVARKRLKKAELI